MKGAFEDFFDKGTPSIEEQKKWYAPTPTPTIDPFVEKGWQKTGKNSYIWPDGKATINAPTTKPDLPMAEPTTAPSLPMAKPTPTPLPDRYSKEDLSEAIKSGFRKWAGLEEQNLPDERIPMIKYADKMAEEAMKYPILKSFPFLLPILTILETSGGQPSNTNYENNPFNWGINEPSFKPKSVEETIEKVASGIAKRTWAYEDFRESYDFADLAEHYAPPSENLTEKYIQDYNDLLKVFEEQLAK